MEKLYNRLRQFRFFSKLPEKSKINTALASFNIRERVMFSLLCFVLIVSTLMLLNIINLHFMVSRPIYGGSVSEGIVGAPRFINPVLASTTADLDLVALTYSGLLRKTGTGELIPDLAESYEVSPDGLTYTFILKDDIYFHDGKPVTVDDIIFTVYSVKDPVIKSPHKAAWDGVTAEKIDERTIQFNLKQPNALFLQNATLGIMPKELWSGSPIELNSINTEPVGSGPYKIKDFTRESSGLIDSYELSAFKEFALGRPYLNSISIHFYGTEEDLIKALENGEVGQISSITPENAERLKNSGYRVESTNLPRVFGLFFNQNENRIFTEKAVVNAVNLAVDKDRIVREVLGGYGVSIEGPIPPGIFGEPAAETEPLPRAETVAKILESLSKAGWQKDENGILVKTTTQNKVVDKKGKTVTPAKKTSTPIEFSISTSDAPDLVKTAQIIKENLEEIGIKVDVKTFDAATLNQDVIRPRKYEALLFGQIINSPGDLFAFWHSSQRLDPGLNVAMYTNAKADKLLEDAYATRDDDTRAKKYSDFELEVKRDMPAVFLYSPDLIYVVSKNLSGINLGRVAFSSDRFLNINEWYSEKYNVWKIFAR